MSDDTSGSSRPGSREGDIVTTSEEAGSPEVGSGVSYPSTSGVKAHSSLVQSRGIGSKGNPQRKRTKKDPNAPTKPLSAYLHFLIEKQEEIRNSASDVMSVAEITRQVGAAWRLLSAQERKIYEAKAELAKAQYAQAVKKYELSEDFQRFRDYHLSLDNQSPGRSPAKRSQHEDTSPAKRTNNRTEASPSIVSSVVSLRPQRGPAPRVTVTASKASSSKREQGNERDVRDSSSDYAVPIRKKSHSPVKRVESEEIQESSPDWFSSSLPTTSVHSTVLGRMEEFHVPIWTQEFMQWNTNREKELKQVRRAADDLDIDIAGIKLQAEQVTKQAKEVAESRKKLEDVRKAKKEVSEILITGFGGLKVPSGLVIGEGNLVEYMVEVQKQANKSPSRHPELVNKLRELAGQMQRFASLL